MKKSCLPLLFTFGMVLILSYGCQKEYQDSNELEQLSETELAKRYLNRSSTSLMPFGVLEINHETQRIDGFFLDKAANVREIAMDNAHFLDMDNSLLSEYGMDHLYENSKSIASVSPLALADYVKKSLSADLYSVPSIAENGGDVSKFYFAFPRNLETEQHQECEGTSVFVQTVTYDKVVLSATGRFNYDASSEMELELVNWLQALENDSDN